MNGTKSELFTLIKEVLNHPLVKENKMTLYRGYSPEMTESNIIKSDAEYEYPMLVIMPYYDSVPQHLAWCKGNCFSTVESEISTVKLTLSIMNDRPEWVLPRTQPTKKAAKNKK